MLHYVHNEIRTGFNLALEQVVLRRAAEPAFWFWRDMPSIVVGRHQVIADEVNLSESTRRSVPVFRRASGGGAVYHDLGVFNFTFVLPANASVARALSSVIGILGVSGVATERNDVLVGGRKIIGTAQFVSGSRRLFHGSLLYAADLDALSFLLSPSPSKLRRHGVASVRARVENLSALLPRPPSSADAFFSVLRRRAARAFAGPVCPVPDEVLAEAEDLSGQPRFRQIPLEPWHFNTHHSP